MHTIADVNETTRTATCGECGPSSSVTFKKNKGRWICTKQARRRGPGAARRHRIKRVYGLTESQYDGLLVSQGGVCAICDQICSTGRHLAVDHDHETGRVRGLLCHRCNRALGFMQDRPERLLRAVKYLQS